MNDKPFQNTPRYPYRPPFLARLRPNARTCLINGAQELASYPRQSRIQRAGFHLPK